MKKVVFIFLLMILGLSSCKRNRFSHSDGDYYYYWIYKINGDSILREFHKPRTVEYRVSGGRHGNAKNRTHRINVYKSNGDGSHDFESVIIRGSNQCEIVNKARDAKKSGKVLIGIFRESFYPNYKLEFIGYK